MTSLVESRDESKWRRALESYEDKIAVHSASGKRRSKLVDLDQAVRVAIPEAVNARRNDANPVGYLTKADICQIVEWKITVDRYPTYARLCWLSLILCSFLVSWPPACRTPPCMESDT